MLKLAFMKACMMILAIYCIVEKLNFGAFIDKPSPAKLKCVQYMYIHNKPVALDMPNFPCQLRMHV